MNLIIGSFVLKYSNNYCCRAKARPITDETYFDYTRKNDKQIAFVRILDNGKCIKVCVRFEQKSRLKDRNYLIARVTTVGKIDYSSMKNKKDYKKIE